jgi:hypothetical protein
MTSHIIRPPEYEDKIQGPFLFLAGPIQGTYDWQEEAIKYINQLAPFITIASPRRLEETQDRYSDEKKKEQVDWETYHLRKASEQGGVIFWLANEQTHLCRRTYAQTSRFELAEWKIRHERDGINLILGIDSNFSSGKYIRRRFSQDCPNIQICSSLEETCQEAIAVLHKTEYL